MDIQQYEQKCQYHNWHYDTLSFNQPFEYDKAHNEHLRLVKLSSKDSKYSAIYNKYNPFNYDHN